MSAEQLVLDGFISGYLSQKRLADAAIAQLDERSLRTPLDENTNSVAVIMKHVSGNLISRFTEFLTSDGEKPWRDRDAEFVDTFNGAHDAIEYWEAGWTMLLDSIRQLQPEHLAYDVFIRGERLSVPAALSRSLAHTSYHCGQIVLTARILAKGNWNTITIPRGQSQIFNQRLGYQPPRA